MKNSRRTLLHASAGATLLSLPLAAMAIPFQLGPIAATIDSTISAGLQLRTQGPDASNIGIANGGTARSVNEDDGNLSFEKGDITSANIKATHELEFKYQNYGVFSRVSYFYDQTSSNADKLEDRRNAAGNYTVARNKGSYELGPRGRDRLGSEFRLLDLFAYGNFDVMGRGLTVRAGKQVINWGESTFIGNSINVVNPVDVSRLRQPGAELKEALLPTPIISAQLQITGDLSLEGIYLAAYDKTQIDPRGAFFSTNDFVSDDGDRAITGFGRRQDDNTVTRPAGGSGSVWLPREGNRDPENTTNQYGFAVRYYSEFLNNTEFGLYQLKYHSRVPLVSAIRGGQASPGGNSTNSANGAVPTCSASPATTNCRATYFSEYPENIELYGLSFNTTAPYGIAVQGEYSFRPNLPLQKSGAEVLLTALGVRSSINDSATPLPRGTYIRGYDQVPAHQMQATLTKAFGPTLGAQQFVLLGEAAVTHLDFDTTQRYAAPGTALPSCGAFRALAAGTQAAVSNGSCQEEVGGGYASKDSWGYRAVGRFDFENVVGAVQFSPRLAWAHDVNGNGPNFTEKTKALTTGLGLNYLQRWQADLSYTAFIGGRTYAGRDTTATGPAAIPGDTTQAQTFATSANPNKDRDFLALSVSYAF